MTGGVGMRPRPARSGDSPARSTLDFWRVEVYEPGRRLRLFAEMKCRAGVAGVPRQPDGPSTVLTQIAQFERAGSRDCSTGIFCGPSTK